MAKPKSEKNIGNTEHWERRYNPTPDANVDPNGQWLRNWDPKYGKNRPQPHNKINDLDH